MFRTLWTMRGIFLIVAVVVLLYNALYDDFHRLQEPEDFPILWTTVSTGTTEESSHLSTKTNTSGTVDGGVDNDGSSPGIVIPQHYPLVGWNPMKEESMKQNNPYLLMNLPRIHELIDNHRLMHPREDSNNNNDYEPPYETAVICGCYKCGSTSFFQFLYELIFDREFQNKNYKEKGAWVQQTTSPEWKGAFHKDKLPNAQAPQVLADPHTFSFALVREPISRLVSSWKSKLACDDQKWHTDTHSRSHMIQKLLQLAGMPYPSRYQQTNSTAANQKKPHLCLEFSEYVEALRMVYQRGKQHRLNGHFIPQHLYCLRTTEPSDWMHIALASDPSIGPTFAKLFGLRNNQNVTSMLKEHSSGRAKLQISDHDMAILKAITAEERAIINPLLSPRGSNQ